MQANKDKDLMFGTLDSWLIYKLNGGQKHVTEPSNAISTGNLFSQGIFPEQKRKNYTYLNN